MPEDDFYTPTDADELRMENELLAYEVEFLRAMLSDPLIQVEEHRIKLQNARKETNRLREENAHFRERRQQLQQRSENLEKKIEKKDEEVEGVRADLIRLLESLSGGATELALRRSEVFRELKDRYL